MIAGTVAEHEGNGLHQAHQGKHHADSARGAGVADQPHKIGVRHIIQGGDEHTDDGGHRQRKNQPGQGAFRHSNKFFFLREGRFMTLKGTPFLKRTAA